MILTAPKDGKRRPSFRGALVFKTWKGKVVVQAWPKPRGPAKTPGQAFRQEWFRQANVLARYAPARQQALSRCAMKHLPVRPYDALIAAMAGRLWAIETDDRGTLYSMGSRADVSKNLDVLSQTPSSIMCRGEAFWDGCIPTAEGQLYVSGPPGQVGSFKDIPGGKIPAARLKMTADQWALGGVWTTLIWGGVDFEDWTAWAPGAPTLMIPKPDTTRMFVVLTLSMQGGGGNHAIAIDVTRPGVFLASSNALYPNNPSINLTSGPAGTVPGATVKVNIKPVVDVLIKAGNKTSLSIQTLDAP